MDVQRDYAQDYELIKQFLRDFTHIAPDGTEQSKYGPIMTKLANRELTHMYIDLLDVEKFNMDLARQIGQVSTRYNQIFYEVLDELLPLYKTKEPDSKDIMDVFIEQRLMIRNKNQRSGTSSSAATTQPVNDAGRLVSADIDGQYPPDLIRRAELTFKPANFQFIPIREVRAEHVGKLVTIRGIVTRVTDVKPQLTVATYTCDQCGCETFQPVRGPYEDPLVECSSVPCKSSKTLGRITLQIRGSKTTSYQEVKLQEHSDQVPTGHIPRTISLTMLGELTRSCTAGDHVSITGIFLPIERGGFRMRSQGLASDTFIRVHYVAHLNKTEDDELNLSPMSQEEVEDFTTQEGSFLNKLSSSIAPEIHGHDNLKKALLLLLVGGSDTNYMGLKIRGNINICLMGDPGVAKSQLLSFIDRIASRSQYTTGRGSSGVGLTAAVLKDPITNELVLEGGALVLADRGICCIDEFDKMMDADRTAIHEVMEQQTISIAKAGVNTTLNARVSILAAANPAYGRYNVHRSIEDNLQLPPALLSRFDLLWLIRDRPNRENDLSLAQHVTHVHSHPDENIPSDYGAVDLKSLRRYVSLCQTKNPRIPEDLATKLVEIYVDIRNRRRKANERDALFTSPRCLLAIIRLSTALARLRLADLVEPEDIDAAVALYNNSRDSLEGSWTEKSKSLCIYEIIKKLASEFMESRKVPLDRIYEETEMKGYDRTQVDKALDELHEMDILHSRGRFVMLYN